MGNSYSIKDVESLTGIKAHTIRIWEQRYRIIRPERTCTNIRCYTDKDLKKLLNVAVLVQSGMRISKVAELSDEALNREVLNVTEYKGTFESQINGLKLAMMDFNQDLFEKVLSNSIIQLGVDQTFHKVVGLFVKQLRYLWQTSSITTAHKHFISNLIRQKLLSITDQLTVTPHSDPKKYVLYLPCGEKDELALLYLNYHIHQLGHKSLYLGQETSCEYLKEIHDKLHVDFFVSIFTNSFCNEKKTKQYLDHVSRFFAKTDCQFLYTSNHFDSTFPPYPGMYLFEDFMQMKTAIVKANESALHELL